MRREAADRSPLPCLGSFRQPMTLRYRQISPKGEGADFTAEKLSAIEQSAAGEQRRRTEQRQLEEEAAQRITKIVGRARSVAMIAAGMPGATTLSVWRERPPLFGLGARR